MHCSAKRGIAIACRLSQGNMGKFGETRGGEGKKWLSLKRVKVLEK